MLKTCIKDAWEVMPDAELLQILRRRVSVGDAVNELLASSDDIIDLLDQSEQKEAKQTQDDIQTTVEASAKLHSQLKEFAKEVEEKEAKKGAGKGAGGPKNTAKAAPKPARLKLPDESKPDDWNDTHVKLFLPPGAEVRV